MTQTIEPSIFYGLNPNILGRIISLFLICSLSSTSRLAYAQDSSFDSGALSSATQASVVEKKIEEEQKPGLETEQKKPEIKIETKEREEYQLPNIHFLVREIAVEGNTIFTHAELKPLLIPYENQELTIEKIKALTQSITQKYRQEGFGTSFAYLPHQQVRAETLRINVFEGKVDTIKIEENRFFRKKQIRSYFSIQEGEVLNIKKIESALRHLNEHPDRTVQAKLIAGTKPATSDIVLTVKDRFPVHLSTRYDNEGVKSSGKQRFQFALTNRNLTSLDDTLSVGTVFGKHFGFLFTRYELPFPKTNTKLIGGFSHGQSTPKKELSPFGVNSLSQMYSGGLEQNLFRRNRFTMDLGGGFELRESRTRVDSGTFTRERLRILRLAPKALVFGPRSVTSIVPEFRFGINGMGASIHADRGAARQGVEPTFFIFHGKLNHIQKMPLDTKTSIEIEFQHSSKKLPSQEAFYLGGASTVRGYPEGDYLADSGIRATLEYLVPTFFFPKSWELPFSKTPLRNEVEIVAFLDDGYGRLRGPSRLETQSRHLIGMGGGLRIHLYQNLFARLEWAAAVGDHPLRAGNRHEFYFRLQAEQ